VLKTDSVKFFADNKIITEKSSEADFGVILIERIYERANFILTLRRYSPTYMETCRGLFAQTRLYVTEMFIYIIYT